MESAAKSGRPQNMAKAKIPAFGEVKKGITYVDRPGAYGFLAAADVR